MPTHTIRTFSFPNDVDKVADTYHGTNWPVVYLIHNDDEIYVGETTSAAVRYANHADQNGRNWEYRKRLNTIEIIFDNHFHKSAILDIEQSLIQLLEADNAIEKEKHNHYFSLQNKNGGQSNQHDYYNRTIYQTQLEGIWADLINLKLANNSYSDIKNSDLFKYSPYNSLTNEQETACRAIIRDMISCLKTGEKGTAILKGAAGTGKSIVLINMICTLVKSLTVSYDFDPSSDEASEINDRLKLHKELRTFFSEWKTKTGQSDLKIGFVVPMSSIRSTFKAVFTATDHLRGNWVIGPNSVVTDQGEREYDVVFVDEAHRLKRRKAMSGIEMGAFDKCCAKLKLNPQEATHLDFILAKTKYQVLVYDENQTVKPADIPDSDFKSRLATRHLIEKELKSQMRCKGGGDYMGYLDDIFNVSSPDKKSISDFEFKLFDDPNELINSIIQKDSEEGLCRTVAGYAWEWISSKEKNIQQTSKGPIVKYKSSKRKFNNLAEMKAAGRTPDIDFNGEKYYWNIDSCRWILNSSPEEIGCIHTTQGYDLNYVGVILGKEIDYDPKTKQITIDRSKFYDVKVKENTDDATLKKYIINAYKVMMVRGIHGCYVYACNPNMQAYLRNYIDK